MKPGKAFEIKVETAVVGVVYTSHFAEEYHKPYKYRPPVERFVSEEQVRPMIEEAIQKIAEYQAADPTLQGVIMAMRSGLNMSFFVRPNSRGFTLVMGNMMLKRGYVQKNAKDYVIKINPIYEISFERSIDQEVRVAVIEHLGEHALEFEEDAFYSVATELVSFGVERFGNHFEVDYAGWNQDMLYIPVLETGELRAIG